MDQRQSFIIIGAGNVAFHLGGALAAAGYRPLQVIGRDPSHSRELARLLNSGHTTVVEEISPDADFYVIAANDNSIATILREFPFTGKLVFHTSGSAGTEVFGKKFDKYGVFYPLQTFSKKRALDFHKVPVFLEASDPSTLGEMKRIAGSISNHVREIAPGLLMRVHIAAVFACNFTNHMFAIADILMKEIEMPFDILRPLIEETFLKLSSGSPSGMQTGPAVRGDTESIDKHLKALGDHPEYQKIYTFVSQNIQDLHIKKSE